MYTKKTLLKLNTQMDNDIHLGVSQAKCFFLDSSPLLNMKFYVIGVIEPFPNPDNWCRMQDSHLRIGPQMGILSWEILRVIALVIIGCLWVISLLLTFSPIMVTFLPSLLWKLWSNTKWTYMQKSLQFADLDFLLSSALQQNAQIWGKNKMHPFFVH